MVKYILYGLLCVCLLLNIPLYALEKIECTGDYAEGMALVKIGSKYGYKELFL